MFILLHKYTYVYAYSIWVHMFVTRGREHSWRTRDSICLYCRICTHMYTYIVCGYICSWHTRERALWALLTNEGLNMVILLHMYTYSCIITPIYTYVIYVYSYSWHTRETALSVLQCVARGTACSTHCNTLQHTTTHCNTLQHTAAHYNTLQQGENALSSPPCVPAAIELPACKIGFI